MLIADDSAVMRSLLRMVFDTKPRIEVVASASNGEEALAEFERLSPDLVLLDIEMPGRNGLEVLSAIRQRNRRVPVIMCSTLTWRGAQITLEALARGATDYVTKPSAQKGFREGIGTLTRDLIPRVLALFPAKSALPQPPAADVQPAALTFPPAALRAVVIGVSTGGPAALEVLLPAIPADFPLPILLVQHMPTLFTGLLAERLNSLCPLRIREAVSGSRPEPGVVDIARGDWHMELSRDFRIRLHQGEPENFCRPSVDVLFRSATLAASGRLLGVILTGMGSDGLAGCRALRAAGGTVIVQDNATSVIWGMPGAVANAGLANRILPLDAIAGEIQRIVRINCPAPLEAAV
ncbi:MAG TPA: chemotaxis response regulator protein-glutamate methylesterase [Acidobacteriaceae bacterium]|nr:chemotaxis response regulator protein-glutamate methylesterase [Acidobacteriaceae bacterium]